MADINPLRYRGYYYDTETGFYYLQSRYYDPVTHRFINADSYASTGQGFMGTNMFAYCNNNPVNCRDNTGNAAGSLITTTRICDAGSGHSSYEKLLLRELFRGEIPTEYDNPYYGSRVTKEEQIIDMPGIAYFIAENGHILSFAIRGVGWGARVLSKALFAKAAVYAGAVNAVCSFAVQEIFYNGMPVIENGDYAVYTIDTITSQTYYTNGANGNMEMIECHTVSSWYVSSQLQTGTTRYEYVYQVVYRGGK